MSKRKVIIIGPAFPFRGGIANFNNALAQAYHDRGDNITLYSFTLQYPSFLFPGTTQYETGEAPKNLKIKTLINSVNPFNWINVARKINTENPDYVIISKEDYTQFTELLIQRIELSYGASYEEQKASESLAGTV